MPFDPSLPVNDSEIRAAELRAQFTGLRELIDSIPVGPQGPQGQDGVAGPQGEQGAPGLNLRGAWSTQETYSSNDAVTFDGSSWRYVGAGENGEPGSPESGWELLAAKGEQGPLGEPGPQGEQGPPGDVSSQQLYDAIANTAGIPLGIAAFGGTFSDPPTQAEMQAFADWAESLRVALRREV